MKCSIAGGGGATAEEGLYWEDLSAVSHEHHSQFWPKVKEGTVLFWLCLGACLCCSETGLMADCNFTAKSADLKRGLSIFKLGKEKKKKRKKSPTGCLAACVQSRSHVLCRCDLRPACISCAWTYGSFTWASPLKRGPKCSSETLCYKRSLYSVLRERA